MAHACVLGASIRWTPVYLVQMLELCHYHLVKRTGSDLKTLVKESLKPTLQREDFVENILKTC